MSGEDGYFGENVAARYDEDYGSMFEPDHVSPVVDLLVELAGEGRALELGIGTGRIAVPLAQRGVPVHGIDLSNAMVARLREKSGAEEIGVTIGDFATARAEGTFAVAYLVFNTLMNLRTQPEQVACFRNVAGQLQPGGCLVLEVMVADLVFNTLMNLRTQPEQVACFRNVAGQLEPGGCFVLEVMVADLQRLPPGESSRPFDLSADHVGLDEYDVATQGLRSHHFTLVDGSWEYTTFPGRYVWPAELDLMAGAAGMSLRDRWGDWNREPFTSESRKHVSVWEKPR